MRTFATLVLTFSLAVCLGCGGQPSYKDRTPDASADDPGAAVASDPGIGSDPAADAPESTEAEGETEDETAKEAE